MKKTLKICIGILFSAALFYLFIKDVNRIPIVHDSGLDQGSGDEKSKVIYVTDAGNFEIGDEVEIRSEGAGAPLKHRVVRVVETTETGTYPYIVTAEPVNVMLRSSDNPVIVFPRLQRALLRANYWWIFPALVMTIVALWIRAYRWKFFFIQYEKIAYRSLWRSVCIGYMANNVLPFRIGEIVRAWYFGRKENRRVSEVFGTIVLERIFDILSILILYVAYVIYFAALQTVNLPGEMILGAWVMGFIAISALAFLLALRYWTVGTRRFIKWFLDRLPASLARRIDQLIETFIHGLWIFDSWRCILAAFSLSMVIWIVLALAYLFVFYAVGIPSTLLVSLFLIVALAFAVSIPSAPGFIGTFHWVGQQVLLLMGLKGNIEAYVLLAHLLAYIPVVVLGFFYLSIENISWKELRTSAVKLNSQTDTPEK